jgi:hypothetical protein
MVRSPKANFSRYTVKLFHHRLVLFHHRLSRILSLALSLFTDEDEAISTPCRLISPTILIIG